MNSFVALVGVGGFVGGWLACAWATSRNREVVKRTVEHELDAREREREQSRARAMQACEDEVEGWSRR